MSLTTKVTDIETILNSWHRLDKLKRQQEGNIANLKYLIEDIKKSWFFEDNIRSELTVVYGVEMTLPKGSGISDPTGNYVTQMDKVLHKYYQRLNDAQLAYIDTCTKLGEIHELIAGLSERHKRVLEMMYRDKAHHSSISGKLYISKARVYDMRDEAVAEIRRWA